jgi:hypothetical protein
MKMKITGAMLKLKEVASAPLPQNRVNKHRHCRGRKVTNVGATGPEAGKHLREELRKGSWGKKDRESHSP